MGSREAHDLLQNRLFDALDRYEFADAKWFHLVREDFRYSLDGIDQDVDVAAFHTVHLEGAPAVNEVYAFEVKSSGSKIAREHGIAQILNASHHFTRRLDYDRFFGYLVTKQRIEEIAKINATPLEPAHRFHEFFRHLATQHAYEHAVVRERMLDS